MDKPQLDSYHFHEASDRLSIIMDMIDSHLIQHPVMKLNDQPRRLVEKSQELLIEAYQQIGNIQE